jgi:hypothetical protein
MMPFSSLQNNILMIGPALHEGCRYPGEFGLPCPGTHRSLPGFLPEKPRKSAHAPCASLPLRHSGMPLAGIHSGVRHSGMSLAGIHAIAFLDSGQNHAGMTEQHTGIWLRLSAFVSSQLKEQVVHPVILDVDVSIFTDQAEGLFRHRKIAEFHQIVCRDIPRDHDGKGTVLVADGFPKEERPERPWLIALMTITRHCRNSFNASRSL